MQTLHRLLTITMVIALMAGLAGLGMAGELQQKLVQESTVEQVMKRGTLRVGMSTFVPWAMKDKTGKLIGFEIDVARQLALELAELGREESTAVVSFDDAVIDVFHELAPDVAVSPPPLGTRPNTSSAYPPFITLNPLHRVAY